jgi:hypothetical protein
VPRRKEVEAAYLFIRFSRLHTSMALAERGMVERGEKDVK